MSWWLSKPIQVYLHEQTDYKDGKPVGTTSQNAHGIDYLIEALAPPRGARPATAKSLQCPQDNNG
jgi:hypothetical protein